MRFDIPPLPAYEPFSAHSTSPFISGMLPSPPQEWVAACGWAGSATYFRDIEVLITKKIHRRHQCSM